MSGVALKILEMDAVLRTQSLLSDCRRLTLCAGSGMNCALNRYEIQSLNRPIKSKAIMAYDESGTAIAWALYAEDPATDTYRYSPDSGSICFQIYVEPALRRKGIGSMLMNKAKELAKENVIKVYKDDAPYFFDVHNGAGNVISIYSK